MEGTLTDAQVQNIAQAVAAAVQGAMQQAAQQTAQQIAEQVGQSVSQAIQKFMQTTGGVTEQATSGRTVGTSIGERVEDIGGGEAHERALNNETGILFANLKRSYDEYQHESLESIKRNRSYVDKVLSDAATHDNRVRQIAEQALQNAVETSNMVGKQAVRHGDIAIDREWNIDEVSDLAAKTGLQQDLAATIATTVTAAVLAALKQEKTA